VISDPSDETPGGLYAYDGESVEVIDRISTTGIASAPDGRLLRVLRSFDDPGSSGEVLTYDDRGVLDYRRLDGVADCHGAAWHDGSFVVVSTATNSLVWVDESRREAPVWRPNRGFDSWHLNDLFSEDGLLYATAFGRFDDHRGWVGNVEGAGVLFTVPDNATLLEGLSAPHNPRLVDHRWFVCNSAARANTRSSEARSRRDAGRLEGDGSDISGNY